MSAPMRLPDRGGTATSRKPGLHKRMFIALSRNRLTAGYTAEYRERRRVLVIPIDNEAGQGVYENY